MKELYQPIKNKRQPTITKGDKTIDPTEFFGMWKEQPKNLADIRKKAWHRNDLSGFNQGNNNAPNDSSKTTQKFT